ncbi:MAG: pilus assembly protein N-terminal domain-containing protein, partial [Reyranellaceae bacterium]
MAEVSAQAGDQTKTRPRAAPSKVQPRRVERGPSAEDLNRRFLDQLKTARAVEPAPSVPPAKPAEEVGFFGRLFGSGPSPSPTLTQAQAQVSPPTPSPTPPTTTPPDPGGQAAPQPSLPPPEPQPLPRRTSQPKTSPAPPAPAPVPVPPPPPPGVTTIPVQPPAAPPPPDRAQRDFGRAAVVPTEAPTMQIEVSKGTMVRLKGSATTVFVANPDIADVQVKSPTQIYVFGKKPGETSLYATDDRDNVLLNTIVRVTHEHSRLQEALRRIAPGSQLQFTTVGDMIVINGTARNAGEI